MENILILRFQKFEYIGWTKILDKTDNNNSFENLKNAIDKLTQKQRYVIINYYSYNDTLA